MTTTASRAMVATMVSLVVVSGMAVVLRVYARYAKKLTLKADDYLVIAAWVFSAALAITNITGVYVGGFGVPFESMSDVMAVEFLKVLFVMQFWYIGAVALVKLSVLYFYGRVFSVVRFPISVKILLALSLGWFISFFCATLFQVWPVWCNWTLCHVPTTNYPVMYVCSSVTDIVLDIAILCLPAFFLRHLHMSLNKKLGLVGIFGLGIFCVVSSIARLAYTITFQVGSPETYFPSNFGPAVVNIIMWSGIEACASTICACLPCYAPLMGTVPGIDSLFASFRSVFFSKRYNSGSSTSRSRPSAAARRSGNSTSSTENIVSNPGGHPSVKTSIRRADTDDRLRREEFKMGEIMVRKSVDADVV